MQSQDSLQDHHHRGSSNPGPSDCCVLRYNVQKCRVDISSHVCPYSALTIDIRTFIFEGKWCRHMVSRRCLGTVGITVCIRSVPFPDDLVAAEVYERRACREGARRRRVRSRVRHGDRNGSCRRSSDDVWDRAIACRLIQGLECGHRDNSGSCCYWRRRAVASAIGVAPGSLPSGCLDDGVCTRRRGKR